MKYIWNSIKFVLTVVGTCICIYVVFFLGSLFHQLQTYGDLGVAAGFLGAGAGAAISPWTGQKLKTWFNWHSWAIRLGLLLLILVHGVTLLIDLTGNTQIVPSFVAPEDVTLFIKSRILMNAIFVVSSLIAVFALRDRREKKPQDTYG